MKYIYKYTRITRLVTGIWELACKDYTDEELDELENMGGDQIPFFNKCRSRIVTKVISFRVAEIHNPIYIAYFDAKENSWIYRLYSEQSGEHLQKLFIFVQSVDLKIHTDSFNKANRRHGDHECSQDILPYKTVLQNDIRQPNPEHKAIFLERF